MRRFASSPGPRSRRPFAGRARFIAALFSGQLLATPALAHARLKAATPAKNAVVSSLPETVALTFSEPLELSLSKLQVVDAATHAILSDGAPTNAPAGDATDPKTMLVHLKGKVAGKTTLKVIWQAVAQDTHKTEGQYEFTVEPPPPGK